MSTEPKVTLITGTSRGIGRFLAEHYTKLGHRVVGCSRSERTVEAERYDHVTADVSNEDDVKNVFRHVRKTYGRLDHLINNAGIASMNHAMLTPGSSVRKVVDTNFIGTFLFCREAAKLMSRSGGGRIVNFGTVATPLKLEGEAIYAASKAAVLTLTEILAREFGPLGITVNAIGPTPIETDLIRGVPKDKIAALLQRQAIPRYGTLEDVANVIDFFLKPESGFVTGQRIFLGGVS
jgi:3-oxoacyl-[acyl-carrier protein] reductase